MKRFALVIALVFTTIMSSCLYSHVTLPLSTELNKTDLGQKQGEASTYSVLWLFAWGDAGAAAAAKNGGITTLRHMDRKINIILFGLYTSTTTIVYGD